MMDLEIFSESLSNTINIITLSTKGIIDDNFRKRGNPNDEDWFGSNNRKYMMKKNKSGNKSMFRTNSRGSKQKITKTPKLLKHESSPDEPPVRVKKLFLLNLSFIQNTNYY